MAGRKKILVKVTSNGTLKRVHFCYIDGDLKTAYKRATGQTSSTIIDRISVWAALDFGMPYPKLTPIEIQGFKDQLRYFIGQKYKEIPPELLSKSLINLWITQKMKEEIENG